MPTYAPEHGDIYLLDDRKQLGFSASGTNYSVNPNVWMMSTGAISKGWMVATVDGKNNQITIADKDSIVSILGVALNSVDATVPVTKTTTVVQYSDVITVVSTTGLTSGMMVTGASIPSNTFVMTVIDGTTLRLTRNYPGSNGSVSLVYGNAVEVMTCGMYQFADKVFNLADVGHTLYPSPLPAGSITAPGTIGATAQMTLNRAYAATSGNPLMEVGLIISETSFLVDLNGDARGATGLTQVTALAGESISNNGTPLVVSLGSDGQIYLADRRKSMHGTTAQRNNPMGLLVGANSGYGSGGTITAGEACIVQKLGTIPGFTGLTGGLPVYADISGAYTQNIATFSYYTDVTTPIGVAANSTTLFVTVGFNTQTSDSNPMGSLIAQSQANPDSGWITCLTNASGALAVTGNTGGKAGHLNAVGSTIITAPTSNPKLDGTYDFSALYNVVGTTYGGSKVWAITGSGSADGGIVKINGISYTMTAVETTASLVAAKIASLMASNQAGYVCTNPSTFYVAITNTGAVTPTVIDFSLLTNYTGSVPSTVNGGTTGTTFALPNLFTSTPKFQIKYNNFYQANPPQAPMFRYDTGWATWGTVPSGSSSPTPLVYIDIPVTAFGSNPPVTDLFTDLYIQKGSVIRKIEPNPVIHTVVAAGTTYSRYGYQLSTDSGTPNTVRVEFGSQGLAYFDTATQTYVPIDNTWQYRIFIYKTERYNKYYDYTMDQKAIQLWSLGLVDYTNPVSTQHASIGGYFDRSTTAPSKETRLNYDGNLHVTNQVISQALVVNGLTQLNQSATIENTNVALNTLNVIAPAGQTADIMLVQKTGVGFPYFTLTKDGYAGFSLSTANAPTGILDLRGTAGTIRFNTLGDTLTFVRNGESKISAGNSGTSSLSLQINGTTQCNINTEGDILFASNTGTAIASGSEKVMELRSDDNVSGASLRLYSNDTTTIQGILSSNANGVVLDSQSAATKSVDFRIQGSSAIYVTSNKHVVLGTSSAISTLTVNTTSKILEVRSENNTDGSVLLLATANGTSAKTLLSSQTSGFILDSLSTARSIDLRINGNSALSIDANRYVNAGVRLGVGITPTNVFQVNTGSTSTNGAIFSSTGTIRSLSLFPRNADNANNALVDLHDSSLIYSDTFVIAPSSGDSNHKGFRMLSSGNVAFWGTTTFTSSGTSASQQVEVASGYVKINAAGASTSNTQFLVATSAGVSQGGFGGRFADLDTLSYYYIGTQPVTNTEFKLTPASGNGTFLGTCTASSLHGDLGTSGTPNPNAYITSATIGTAGITTATITEANITALRGGKIGWNPAGVGSVSKIDEAYITTLGATLTPVTTGYFTNLYPAYIEIGAGSTGKAPFVLTTGVSTTNVVDGAMEYTSGNFFLSTDGNRYSVPLATVSNKLRFITTADTTVTLPSGDFTVATDALATTGVNGKGLLVPLSGNAGDFLNGNGGWSSLASETGIGNGRLTLTYNLDGTEQLSTTFLANQSGNADFTINIPASVLSVFDKIPIRTSTGGINAHYFNATSKRSAKENIETFTQSALNIIDATEVVSFNFIGDENKTYRVGFIADDTHEYLATKSHDQIDINNTIGLLLKAVQELHEENKALKIRIDHLESGL
jgi:hypothetical protein